MQTDEDTSWTPGDWGPSRIARLLVFVALFAVVAVLLGRGANPFAIGPRGELVAHVVASAGLAVAIAGVVYVLFERPALRFALWLGTSATFALEVVQFLHPRRSVEMEDFVAGLAGVLLASLILDVLEKNVPLVALARLLPLAAGGAAVALIAMLATDVGTVATNGLEPDGTKCPLTEIVGDGVRLDLRQDPDPNGCLVTTAGGLGVASSGVDETSSSGRVYLSSPLAELSSSIGRAGSLTISARITTAEFSAQAEAVVTLETDAVGTVLQVLIRSNRLEVVANSRLQEPLVGTRLVIGGVEENQSLELEIYVDDRTMSVMIDGEVAGLVRLNRGTIDHLTDDSLQLLIGNTRSERRPFLGTVDWIELDVSPDGE